jgi:hypothetical protein
MARAESRLPILTAPTGRDLLDQFLRLGLVPGLAPRGAPLPPPDPAVGPSMPDGLLSVSLWGRPVDHDGANQASRSAPEFQDAAPAASQMHESNILPDSVVGMFRDSLDDDGLRFLKYGPRSSLEQLAFAQQIHPDAYLSASSAPQSDQSQFQQDRTFDKNRQFVGPDQRLCLRSSGTEEPLAHSLRRGIENAVGGDERPEFLQIAEASIPETQSGVGIDQLEERRRAQVWPGTTPATGDSGTPLPPRIPDVKAIYSKFHRIERDLRDQGLTVGADALKHFIEGGGLPVEFDQARFRSFPVVRQAENGIQKHFVDWMLGTHPRRAVTGNRGIAYVDPGLEQIKSDLVGMKDGETLIRGSHWDAEFPYPKKSSFPLQAIHMATLTPDADLYGATGDAMLRGAGGFTFHRNGNQIPFKGVVEHNFDERFDFEPDKRTFYAPAKDSHIPWQITQEEGLAMQDHGLGKPFRTSARWNQPVSGALTIDSHGNLGLDHIDWGEARPRLTRRGM